MKVGAEPKQVAVLVGLLSIAGYFYFFSGGDTREQEQRAQQTGRQKGANATAVAPVPVAESVQRDNAAAQKRAAKVAAVRGAIQDFKPSLKPRKEVIDPAAIDPQLRTDLLSKVQMVTIQGGNRSLFDFSQPPAPKPVPGPKIIPRPPGPGGMIGAAMNALKPPTGPPPPPPTPPPPPITLKFYGFVGGAKQAAKRAFFLDGEEIQVAAEGDLIKKRYKVIRIGLNSAVVEDVNYKHQQTLTLEEPSAGS